MNPLLLSHSPMRFPQFLPGLPVPPTSSANGALVNHHGDDQNSFVSGKSDGKSAAGSDEDGMEFKHEIMMDRFDAVFYI